MVRKIDWRMEVERWRVVEAKSNGKEIQSMWPGWCVAVRRCSDTAGRTNPGTLGEGKRV